ncbi:hypothetical protein POTOM_000071 [Populus tomentosa]|uniref:GPI mannosyltransferase 2 n=1 Tax=Populus tomentosa TaxID=118781 RepID=A0A8X8APN5_POPTO|nr:hypothetical protein POTOM_000071 [Populus tomentosa]
MGQKLAMGPLPLDEAWGMQPCQLEISRKYESPFSMQPHINFIIKDLMASSAQFEQLKLNNAAKSFQRMMVPFVCTLLYCMYGERIMTVSTRFLSASPLYWFASHLMISPGMSKTWPGYMIWAYSTAYVLLGSLLFSNFYPFT